MYSTFTVKLIDEVRKRWILYQRRYEKRPKEEKEANWDEIAQILSCNKEKCKKLWKNIRDRYVKVKHARERHFANNGKELEAPNYIYFSHLQFLNDSLSNKTDCSDKETTYTISLDDFEPPLLISENIDYTAKFIQLVQSNSIPCDETLVKNLKYTKEFKDIKKELNASFSAGTLRDYWISLIKKYKLFNDNRHHLDPIVNEDIFREMSRRDSEVVEEEQIDEIAIENYEDNYKILHEEPSPKRARIETPANHQQEDDEYDYFAKKVALQLRGIALKNQLVARKAEIEVLKLLMEHESLV